MDVMVLKPVKKIMKAAIRSYVKKRTSDFIRENIFMFRVAFIKIVALKFVLAKHE